MTRPRVVAIDGAAGSGKSTLARGLASALGLPYVNTGVMYRALAALAIVAGVSPDDAASLVTLMDRLSFTLQGSPPVLQVEGVPSTSLTSPEVEATVSTVARHPAVRRLMRRRQRSLGLRGAVMEGRDIATAVFPDAALKLHVVAGLDVRAARRAAERGADAAATATALRARDERDERTNPLEPPQDAVVLDTTSLDVGETLARALAVVRDRAPELLAP